MRSRQQEFFSILYYHDRVTMFMSGIILTGDMVRCNIVVYDFSTFIFNLATSHYSYLNILIIDTLWHAKITTCTLFQ